MAPEEDRVALSVLGKRAFAKQPHEWRFSRLKERECYVQATYRQTVTRSLPADVGLGFASQAGRFNKLELSDAGRELSEAFLDSPEQRGMGKGPPSLRKNLVEWIAGRFEPEDYTTKLCERLGYRHATIELAWYPEWNPGIMEQQIGRVDRIESPWTRMAKEWLDSHGSDVLADDFPKIEIESVVFKGTYDEFQFQVLSERRKSLNAQLFGELLDEETLARIPQEYRDMVASAAPDWSPGKKHNIEKRLA